MMGWGFGNVGVGMMFLFWVVVIFGALWLLANTFPRPMRDGYSVGREGDLHLAESPQDILKRRYASGEIDKAEYETMRRDLDR